MLSVQQYKLSHKTHLQLLASLSFFTYTKKHWSLTHWYQEMCSEKPSEKQRKAYLSE